jgi:hypothetical protein
MLVQTCCNLYGVAFTSLLNTTIHSYKDSFIITMIGFFRLLLLHLIVSKSITLVFIWITIYMCISLFYTCMYNYLLRTVFILRILRSYISLTRCVNVYVYLKDMFYVKVKAWKGAENSLNHEFTIIMDSTACVQIVWSLFAM